MFTNSSGGFDPVRAPASVTVEKLPRLDIRDLQKAGVLDADGWTDWRPFLGPVRIIRATRHAALIFLHGGAPDHPVRVAISWSRPGAQSRIHNPYWACPRCGRNAQHLYVTLAGALCHSCSDKPRFATQTLDKRTRPHREACRIRLVLNAEAKIGAPIPPKPKGMRRARYAKLIQRLLEAESRLTPKMRKKPPPYSTLLNYIR